MDKGEAIGLLKKTLREISHSRKLLGNTQEFQLWHDKVSDIIEAAFGRSSLEYDRFVKAVGAGMKVYDPDQETLDDCKAALKSIIKRYEILAVKPKSSTTAEPLEAPEDYEEKAATKELELILEGTPDMILECVRNTVEKLNSQGHTYDFRRTSGAPDYARWDKTYFASCAISQGEEGRIGTIKLELLPKEKTLFKFLEPEDWTSSFGQFLKRLSEELKSLGFKKSVHSKVWQWLKSHKILSIIILGIPFLAGVIYLMEFFGFFK